MTVTFSTSIFMWIQWGMRIAGNANFYFFQIFVFNAFFAGFLVEVINGIVARSNNKKHEVMCKEIVTGLLENSIKS